MTLFVPDRSVTLSRPPTSLTETQMNLWERDVWGNRRVSFLILLEILRGPTPVIPPVLVLSFSPFFDDDESSVDTFEDRRPPSLVSLYETDPFLIIMWLGFWNRSLFRLDSLVVGVRGLFVTYGFWLLISFVVWWKTSRFDLMSSYGYPPLSSCSHKFI